LHQYSRQQLYDLVWSSPITSVAKTLGVSDVTLAKACRKAGIPIPPRGYWARLKAKRHVLVAPLPQRGFGVSDSICIGDRYGNRGIRLDLDAELPAPPSFSETAEEVLARAELVVARISFPKNLSNPHSLIEKVLKEDDLRKQKMLSEQFYWKKPVFDTVEGRRKLKIFNAIFFVMDRVGAKPYLNVTESINAAAIVGDTRIFFEIEAINLKQQTTANGKKALSRTRLQLNILHRGEISAVQMSWKDEDGLSLENHTREIAAGLLVAGELHYRAQANHSYSWLVERKAEHDEEKRRGLERLERERLERILQIERRKRRQLITDVVGWRRADEISAFVEAVNSREDLNRSLESNEKLRQWSVWALAEADRLDPMKRSPEKLVDYLWEYSGNKI
jgi:hypothetical protein